MLTTYFSLELPKKPFYQYTMQCIPEVLNPRLLNELLLKVDRLKNVHYITDAVTSLFSSTKFVKDSNAPVVNTCTLMFVNMHTKKQNMQMIRWIVLILAIENWFISNFKINFEQIIQQTKSINKAFVAIISVNQKCYYFAHELQKINLAKQKIY